MQGLSFAELRKAVGIRDAGNFSYHLEKLRDRIVVQNDDEYQLTNAGLEIADAILAGKYGDRNETRATETEYICPHCEEQITATYENGLLELVCNEHGSSSGPHFRGELSRGDRCMN